MLTDASLRALRAASPRSHAGFEQWVERYRGLGTQIPATPLAPPRPPRRARRRRGVIGLSAAAAVVVIATGVAVVLTVSGASPPTAYAAARKAIAATTAATSGTMTASVAHGDTSYTLDTTRWSGNDIAVTAGQRSDLATNRQLLLVDGGVYVQQADGTWLHYASESVVGDKLGPVVQLALDNAAGSTDEQILGLATGVTQSPQPDGTTLYTGTIPNSADPAVSPSDDAIMRIIASLRSGNEPGAPGGSHDGLQLRMTVGSDGFVRQLSLAFQQRDTGSPAGDGSYTWTVNYSQLGSTPPITAPATSGR